MTSSEVIHDASSVIEADVSEERQKLAVFIDFDNIQIGVKDTLGKEFDVAVVLEALKERGEVVTKVAYGDWHRAGDQSRQMTQHAVQMVQRNPTPRGDKNGADINLALDARETAGRARSVPRAAEALPPRRLARSARLCRTLNARSRSWRSARLPRRLGCSRARFFSSTRLSANAITARDHFWSSSRRCRGRGWCAWRGPNGDSWWNRASARLSKVEA